jgi:hypothetical protein
MPSFAEYSHMGESMIRFRAVTERNVMGENNKGCGAGGAEGRATMGRVLQSGIVNSAASDSAGMAQLASGRVAQASPAGNSHPVTGW